MTEERLAEIRIIASRMRMRTTVDARTLSKALDDLLVEVDYRTALRDQRETIAFILQAVKSGY